MAISQPGLSLEGFLRWPEKKPALEFENGAVTQKVSPNLHHGALQGELVIFFNDFGRRRKLCRAFPELRTTFAGASRVPDVAVYLWDRIPRAAGGKLARDVYVPPDIVIEIASPGQRINALLRRCRTFVKQGVRVVLLVDPPNESIIIVGSGVVSGPLRGPDPIEIGDVLPGFELTVEQLFAALGSD